MSNADGEKKNDGERKAAKRRCQILFERYRGLPILVVEDALYATARHLRQLIGYGWKYILNVKPVAHKCRFKQFESRRKSGQVKERVKVDGRGVGHD